ncbi:MAG: tetratricopeptide repeat protein [Rhodospirillaceae bacterium]|nr:tetratricopeptide repeat protein [Rhodospirillaceae bacterium]
MAEADPEALWAVLLAEGHAALSEPEKIEVTLWVVGHFPGAVPATFLIESESEAGRVAAFAHHWIDIAKPQLAVPLARLALAAHEQACGVDAEPTASSVAALALALTEVDGREGVPELRREAAGLADRYRTMVRTLAGDADPRIAWGDVIASRLAAADGRSAEAADLMACAYGRVVVACGPLHDFVRGVVDRFIDLDPLRASASMRAELTRRDSLADADDAATLRQIRDVLVTAAHWYVPDEASRLHERLVALTGRLHGPESVASGEALYQQGRFQSLYIDLASGEPALRRALEIQERATPVSPTALGRTMRQLALVQWRRGDAAEAEALLRRTVVLLRRHESGNEAALVAAAIDLADTIQEQGRWQQAEAQFTEAFRIAHRLFGEDASETEEARSCLARFRRELAHHHADGKLFGLCYRLPVPREDDRWALAVRLLFDVAQHALSDEDQSMLCAEGAILLARGGEVARALKVTGGLSGVVRHEWEAAAVYAHAARVESEAHGAAAALRVLETAMSQAGCVAVIERPGDAALDDLYAAVCSIAGSDLVGAFIGLVRESKPAVVQAWTFQAHLDAGELDAAWALLQAMSADRSVPAGDLCRRAAGKGRGDLVRAIAASPLIGAMGHVAVAGLLAVGAPDEAAVLAGSLGNLFDRLEAVVALARAAAVAGQPEAFEKWAGEAVVLLKGSSSGLFQSLAVLAEGAIALMGAKSAAVWARQRLPAGDLSTFAFATIRHLIEDERLDEARAIVTSLDSPQAVRNLEEDIARHGRRAADRAALARIEAHLAAHAPDAVLAEIATLHNAWFAVDRSIALAASAEGDAVPAALRAGLAALPGHYEDEVFAGLAKEHFRYDAARLLGQAARRLLGSAERASFADAAFERAVELVDLPRAATLVIAAGEANLPEAPAV